MSRQPSQVETVYSSGGFTIYPASGQVSTGAEKLSVGLVNMKVLSVLLEHAGEVVTRTTFFDRVWANQVVSDDALTRCISDLRQLFAAHSAEQLIETLPKRGYRWLPAVNSSPGETPVTEPMPGESTAVEADDRQIRSMQKYVVVLLAALPLLVILVASLVLLTGSDQTSFSRMALLPIETGDDVTRAYGQAVEDSLRENLLQTQSLRFLSPAATRNYAGRPYQLMASEQDVFWVMESSVRLRQNEARATLSLVDARTSLVIYQQHFTVTDDPASTDRSVSGFVRTVEAMIAEE